MELKEQIKKSFPKIRELFSESTLTELCATPLKELEKYNFGLGTMIRLKLLKPKGCLYKAFIKQGYCDKNEMSMKMIKEFHESNRAAGSQS
jgi:hypothetical protein